MGIGWLWVVLYCCRNRVHMFWGWCRQRRWFPFWFSVCCTKNRHVGFSWLRPDSFVKCNNIPSWHAIIATAYQKFGYFCKTWLKMLLTNEVVYWQHWIVRQTLRAKIRRNIYGNLENLSYLRCN